MIGAGAIGLSTVAALAARGIGPIVVSDYSDDRLAYAKKFGADVLVNPANSDPFEVLGDVPEQRDSDAAGHLRMRRHGRAAAGIVDSCEFMARVYVAGGWYDAGTMDCTAATRQGMTIQFGGGPIRRTGTAPWTRSRRPAGSIAQHRRHHRPRRGPEAIELVPKSGAAPHHPHPTA